MIHFGGAFSALRGFSENHVTLSENPENEHWNAECGGASGRLRAEGVSGERGAAERGGASDQLRARGRGGEQRALVPHALPGGFGNGPDSDDGLGGAQGARSSQSAPTELPGRIAALEEAQLQPQALVARPTRPGVAVAADGDGAAGRGAAGDVAGRGAAEASVEGRGPLSEVVGWRCLPPGSRSVGAASRRLAFGGTGRAHRQWRLRRRPMCSAL